MPTLLLMMPYSLQISLKLSSNRTNLICNKPLIPCYTQERFISMVKHYNKVFRRVLPLRGHLGITPRQLFQADETRPHLNEWVKSHKFTLSGHWVIKSACIESSGQLKNLN